AFRRGAGDPAAYTTVMHHDEGGFSVWRKSDGQRVRLDEAGVVRLLDSTGLPGGRAWRDRPELVMLSCRVADPALGGRLGRLADLLRQDDYHGDVRGPSTRVEILEDGTVRVPDGSRSPHRSVTLAQEDGTPGNGLGNTAAEAESPEGSPESASLDADQLSRDVTDAELGRQHTFRVDATGTSLADPAQLADLRALAGALRSSVRFQQADGLPVPRVDIGGDQRDAQFVADLLRTALGTDPARPLPEIVVGPGAAGRVTVDVSVPILPWGAEHAPTANSAGGISFDSGTASEGAVWERLHNALPPTSGKKPFSVYVTGRDGRFLVNGNLLDGATLARHVRNSPAFQWHAADPAVPVRLVGADPAHPDRTIQAAKEFAEALRGTEPYRSVTAATRPLKLDAAGHSVPADSGSYEPVSEIRPDDVRWVPLKDSKNRQFGMGFASPVRLDTNLAATLTATSDHSLRAVTEVSTDAAGKVRSEETTTQAWAAATDGPRTRPVQLLLDSAGDDFLVPLTDGSTWRLGPAVTAELMAKSSAFQQLTSGPVRPPLIVLSLVEPAEMAAMSIANRGLLAKLRALTGPWQTHTYYGSYSFTPHAMLTVPRGSEFVEGPPPSPGEVVRASWDNVFGFPVPGGMREPEAETEVLADFVDAIIHGTAELDGPWAPKNPLIVSVDSPDGTFARIATKSGAVLELDGRRLGRMLLADPDFGRQLRDDRERPVLLVARDGGARVNFGGLGFDFAGALRAEGVFTDVYAPDGAASIERDRIGTSGDTRFTLVSDLRAGDVRTSVLKNKAGEPVALFVRYPGDGLAFRRARAWAGNATADRLRGYLVEAGSAAHKETSPWRAGRPPVFLFTGAGERGYQAIRRDGVTQQLTPAKLAQIVRSDPALREMLGRATGFPEDRSLVLATLDGETTGIGEFARSLLRGGYSRAIHHTPSAVRLSGDGSIATGGKRFETTAALLPGPDDVVTYAMANETLGTHGQFFPLNEKDAQDMFLPAWRDSAVRQRYYFRTTEVPLFGHKVERHFPVVAPWAGSTLPTWFLDGHGVKGGRMPFGLKTDRPLHIGDAVGLDGAAGARIVAGTEVFRRAGAHPAAPITLGQCWLMATPAGADAAPAERFKAEWQQITGGPVQVFGATNVVLVSNSNASHTVGDGGMFTEALPDGTRVPEVPLADLAAKEIESVEVVFPGRSTTLPGPRVADVRQAARQVARAAAWRLRNKVTLPGVTIVGFGHTGLLTNARQAKAAGQGRADAVAAVFRDELTEEALRLSRLGLDIRPEQIAVQVFGAAAQPGTVGRIAQLYVRLPKDDVGAEAVQRIFGGDRSDAAVRALNEAFAALAPGHDSHDGHAGNAGVVPDLSSEPPAMAEARSGLEGANAKLGMRGQYFPSREFDRTPTPDDGGHDTTGIERSAGIEPSAQRRFTWARHDRLPPLPPLRELVEPSRLMPSGWLRGALRTAEEVARFRDDLDRIVRVAGDRWRVVLW
ncbi:hypothetical protein, partial [Amycolatopsis rhizosphaerae]|uniref:hypothetical protein n=1 Tax=Amycolatopsis rhizosphaerae TaxID=2053003 RepID=UPI001643B51E